MDVGTGSMVGKTRRVLLGRLTFLHVKLAGVYTAFRNGMDQHHAPLPRPFWKAPHRRSKVC